MTLEIGDVLVVLALNLIANLVFIAIQRSND